MSLVISDEILAPDPAALHDPETVVPAADIDPEGLADVLRLYLSDEIASFKCPRALRLTPAVS